MSIISSLTMNGFRNYSHVEISGLKPGFIVLSGQNGAGKTNCLEAVSLLSHGRGLRGAKLEDMRSSSLGSNQLWAVRAQVMHTDEDDMDHLATGQDPSNPKRRIFKLNDSKLKTSELAQGALSCLWLTPAMDGLFMGATSERRKFFDRLVQAFQPSHATHVRKYEKIMQERARILRDSKQNGTVPDHDWLSVLERQMAALTVSIAVERNALMELMVEQADVFTEQGFPAFDLELIGDYEGLARQGLDMLACEEALFKTLEAKRHDDAVYGGACVGAHRTDMSLNFRDKRMRADQCSTGEQKIMLMGLILTHAHLLHKRHMRPPIILFDEVTAHLDPERREVLFDQLGNTAAQIWLSGTENALFSGIKNAQFFHVQDAQILAA